MHVYVGQDHIVVASAVDDRPAGYDCGVGNAIHGDSLETMNKLKRQACKAYVMCTKSFMIVIGQMHKGLARLV